MFTIDFTKPFLYKDIIYFNQGNLAANNILRCKLVTGGDETLEGYIATVTFKTLSNPEINGTVNIIDDKNCIVDIKFPSNALEVGVNELEVILSKGEGADKVVTPSPIIKYEVWQCITTGNGVQGDNNYPILIDLISDVNNAVRIANNASATADVSLKQTAKMLDVVNTNISRANETIDNTNSAKDKALNAVKEVNTAKDNLISEVNAAKNTMIEDINSSKESMVADTNKAIDKMNKDYESLTSKQQQDMEVIKARGKYDSLSQRFEGLDKDLLKAKELTATTVTTESNFATIEETTNGYIENIKLEGKTLIVNSRNEEVVPGTEGATLKSVGDDVDEIVVSSVNENEFSYSNYLPSSKRYILTKKLFTEKILNNSSKQITIAIGKNETWLKDMDIQPYTICDLEKALEVGEYCYVVYGNDLINENNVMSKVIISSNFKQDKKQLLYYDTESQSWKKPVLREWDSIEKHSDRKYYYHKRSKKVVIDGRESGYGTPSVQNGFISFHNTDIIATNKLKRDNLPNELCDKLPVYIYSEKPSDSEYIIFSNDGTLYFALSSSKLTTLDIEGVKSYLSSNHIAVIAPLEEEEVYECTPIDLLTFENETNYMIDCGAISPKTTLKCVNYIGNVINTLKEKVSNLEDKLYNTNLANFTVALNTLDTKLKLEQLTKTPR